MRSILLAVTAALVMVSCNNVNKASNADNGNSLKTILDQYWNERMQLFPFEATANGDNRYNDKLTITISKTFRDSLGRFYKKYLTELNSIDTGTLSAEDLVSYKIFRYETEINLEGLQYPTHLMPITQFWSFTLELPQLGSGTGNQPFKTKADYENWLKRLAAVPAWADTAIANMREGIKTGWVLPHSLVIKVIPQLKAIVKKDTNSIFFDPIRNVPSSFTEGDKKELRAAYIAAIDSYVNVAYSKLNSFMEQEYLPKSRATSGLSSMPGGKAYYDYCIRAYTTTNLSVDSVYHLGELEVARIESEMIKTKDAIGFKGDLQALFSSIEHNPKLYPFTTPKQVLDSFWAIKKLEDPQLKKMFRNVPKTQFTIRQTEDFRAASASAEYNQGSPDGTRPGIFYVPILDAKAFNAAGMATLFLHEAIPGHHYQISLQQENLKLPTFRRFLGYSAYVEGWAHYCETLGKGLGLYDDPYQYLGHLGDAMHRAIRLVVDAGIHARSMSREEAIKYMMAHEQISEHDATAEIERYMAIPGQALSYKVGQMAISRQRKYYEEQLGTKFDLAGFHDEVLKDGCVPLNILQDKLAIWAKNAK